MKATRAFYFSSRILEWEAKIAKFANFLPSAEWLTQARAFAAVLVALSSGCTSSSTPAATCGKAADAGAGTWTDTNTCLMWQDPLFVDRRNWDDAFTACDTLELAGYAGWRLPTLDELRSIARGCPATATGGACTVTDACLESTCSSDLCQGCAELSGPGPGGCYRLSNLIGDCMTTWTSSAVPDIPDEVWTVGFGGCHVLHYPKTMNINTRCVR